MLYEVITDKGRVLPLRKIATVRIDILTVLPELLDSPLNHSILKRAVASGVAELVVHNIRDYSTQKHQQVDDYSFGGGAGMVLAIEPIDRLLTKLKGERTYDEIIFMTPDGERFNQPIANGLSVITSYSIHYTKLYELVVKMGIRSS